LKVLNFIVNSNEKLVLALWILTFVQGQGQGQENENVKESRKHVFAASRQKKERLTQSRLVRGVGG